MSSNWLTRPPPRRSECTRRGGGGVRWAGTGVRPMCDTGGRRHRDERARGVRVAPRPRGPRGVRIHNIIFIYRASFFSFTSSPVAAPTLYSDRANNTVFFFIIIVPTAHRYCIIIFYIIIIAVVVVGVVVVVVALNLDDFIVTSCNNNIRNRVWEERKKSLYCNRFVTIIPSDI